MSGGYTVELWFRECLVFSAQVANVSEVAGELRDSSPPTLQ